MYLYVYMIHIYFFRHKQHQNDARRSFAGLGRKAFFDLLWFSLEFIGSWDSAYLKGSQSEMDGLSPGGFYRVSVGRHRRCTGGKLGLCLRDN